LRKRREDFLRTRPPGMDYRRELLRRGSVINHLRTYRKQVLEDLGGFNEKLRHGEDYEMALRIADQHDIGLVPEFLYAYRIHPGNTSESLRFKAIRFWWRGFLSARELARSGRIRFPVKPEYSLAWSMLAGLGDALGLGSVECSINRIRSLANRALGLAHSQVLLPLARRIYRSLPDNLSWWPIDWLRLGGGNPSAHEKRVAYYVWRFPTLSQTFIQREVTALRDAGLPVQVVADAAEDVQLLGEGARSLLEDTHYLLPIQEERLWEYKHHFVWSNPLRYVSLLLYVVFHRYTRCKTFAEDREVFDKAVYLAGTLKDRNVSHIHSPWADQCAFVSLIASRLLRVPYSVQGRAHDLHRDSHRYAQREKLENAEFVITNTRYNESYIRSLMSNAKWRRVSVINNGIDLARCVPRERPRAQARSVGVLCVARLAEEKGLQYLLKACRILNDGGLSFECQIIGGPEEPLYADYIVRLKKLHRELGLEDGVAFLGPQPFEQVLTEYSRADIFVLPCVIAKSGGRDIIPNVLIEAMAMRLPVVSTLVSGIPEIVEDGVSGILVPPNDEQALADAISKLAVDPGLRHTLGENARRRVEDRFDIRENIGRYIELFTAGSSRPQ
ncbi:MAG: glycosyltransferase, partial [Anaerolineae bacterium]